MYPSIFRQLHDDHFSEAEANFDLALTIAAEHRGAMSPNPPVGCVLVDRRRSVPDRLIAAANVRGLEAFRAENLEATLDELGRWDALEVLAEAGSSLTTALFSTALWDEHVLIHQPPACGPEIVGVRRRDPARLERFTIGETACSPA